MCTIDAGRADPPTQEALGCFALCCLLFPVPLFPDEPLCARSASAGRAGPSTQELSVVLLSCACLLEIFARAAGGLGGVKLGVTPARLKRPKRPAGGAMIFYFCLLQVLLRRRVIVTRDCLSRSGDALFFMSHRVGISHRELQTCSRRRGGFRDLAAALAF